MFLIRLWYVTLWLYKHWNCGWLNAGDLGFILGLRTSCIFADILMNLLRHTQRDISDTERNVSFTYIPKSALGKQSRYSD
jgi:hypothetical protein